MTDTLDRESLARAMAIRMFSLTQAALGGGVWNELSEDVQSHHLSNAYAALEAIERQGFHIEKSIPIEGKVT